MAEDCDKPFFERFSSDDPHYAALVRFSKLHEAVARFLGDKGPLAFETVNESLIEIYDKAVEPLLEFVTDLSSAKQLVDTRLFELFANGYCECLFSKEENPFSTIEIQNEFRRRVSERAEYWIAETCEKGRTCIEGALAAQAERAKTRADWVHPNRLARGWTLKKLAAESKLSENTIRSYLSGKVSTHDWSNRGALAKAFELNVQEAPE